MSIPIYYWVLGIGGWFLGVFFGPLGKIDPVSFVYFTSFIGYLWILLVLENLYKDAIYRSNINILLKHICKVIDEDKQWSENRSWDMYAKSRKIKIREYVQLVDDNYG
jgi:hypothetical protein